MHEANSQCRQSVQACVGRDSGFDGFPIGECGVDGRTQVNRRNGFAAHAFLEDVEVSGGTLMNDSLREIHIKICPALIVMYSQRHVC